MLDLFVVDTVRKYYNPKFFIWFSPWELHREGLPPPSPSKLYKIPYFSFIITTYHPQNDAKSTRTTVFGPVLYSVFSVLL